MRCFMCVSMVPSVDKDPNTDVDNVVIRTFCKLLGINFDRHQQSLQQIVFCSQCKELIELIDDLADDGNPSDRNLILQNFLDGYLQQMDRESQHDTTTGIKNSTSSEVTTDQEIECPFQTLRHEILKELGMVVELNEEHSGSKFQYNVIDFNCHADIKETYLESEPILTETFAPTISCTDSFEKANNLVIPTKIQDIMNKDATTTAISDVKTSKTSRRSKRKPLNPVKGLFALAIPPFGKPEVKLDKPILSQAEQQSSINKSPKKKKIVESTMSVAEASTVAFSPCNNKVEQSSQEQPSQDSKISPRHSIQGSPLKRAKLGDSPSSVQKMGIESSRTSPAKSVVILNSMSEEKRVQVPLYGTKGKKEAGTRLLHSVAAETGFISSRASAENEENVTFLCEYPDCKRKYADVFRFEAHKKRAHEGQKNAYSCSKCNKSFPTIKRLNNHLEKHKEAEEEHPCNQCELIFPSKAKLNFHSHHHANDWTAKCDVCGKGFQSTGRLEQHKKVHDSDKPFQCDSCPKTFRTLQYLNIHKKNHPPPSTELNKFPCDLCDASFSHLSTLREHQRVHTGKLDYTCDVCGEKFAFSSRLKRHQSVRHSNKKAYQCRYCDRSFKQAGNLKCHENRHDMSNKKIKCPYEDCTLTFFDENKLKYHITVHTGEKPFVCTEASCGRSFRLKAALKLHHASVHAKLKNYKCNVCDRRFSQRQYLNYHLTTHPELDRPRFICDQPGCGKSFAEPSSLKEHVRKHTGDYRFECEHCPSKFAFKSRLVKHMATHSEAKNFQCTKCQKNFSVAAYLRRHMRCVHDKKKRKTDQDYIEEEEDYDESNNAYEVDENQQQYTVKHEANYNLQQEEEQFSVMDIGKEVEVM